MGTDDFKSSAVSLEKPGHWVCSICTLHNNVARTRCAVCRTDNPTQSKKTNCSKLVFDARIASHMKPSRKRIRPNFFVELQRHIKSKRSGKAEKVENIYSGRIADMIPQLFQTSKLTPMFEKSERAPGVVSGPPPKELLDGLLSKGNKERKLCTPINFPSSRPPFWTPKMHLKFAKSYSTKSSITNPSSVVIAHSNGILSHPNPDSEQCKSESDSSSSSSSSYTFDTNPSIQQIHHPLSISFSRSSDHMNSKFSSDFIGKSGSDSNISRNRIEDDYRNNRSKRQRTSSSVLNQSIE